MRVLMLIWPGSKDRRKKKGSQDHDEPGTDTEGTESRPSQEGGGPRSPARRRGMTLRELRRARKLTQVRMAKELGIGQDGISKLESAPT